MPALFKTSVKVFPAVNGDCLLISWKDHLKENNILIDCGFPETYREYLLPELKRICSRGAKIDLLVITHIDADHLAGAIPFLKDNISSFISISQIWHNTFRHIQEPLSANTRPGVAEHSVLEAIIQRGYRIDKKTAGEISAIQGTTVGALILKNNYRWNDDFEGKAVSTDNRQIVEIGDKASIFLLSPTNSELAGLARFWRQELRKYNVKSGPANQDNYDDAFEMMLSWEKNVSRESKEIASVNATPQLLLNKGFKEDTSVTNGSSIAFVLQVCDRKMLLLGDAHPSVVERQLNIYQAEKIIIFDLIKLSHHGSFNNISRGLLDRTDSPKYIFSANGKHGHPQKETIAHIITRRSDFLRTLYFNYRTENSDFFDREDWKRTYNYEIAYLNITDNTLTL